MAIEISHALHTTYQISETLLILSQACCGSFTTLLLQKHFTAHFHLLARGLFTLLLGSTVLEKPNFTLDYHITLINTVVFITTFELSRAMTRAVTQR